MTVYRKSVSWGKFKAALTCPLMVQKTIDKEFSSKFKATSRPAALGKLVQKVFELYFNKDLNLKPEGRRVVVLERILDKVIASPWAAEEGVDKSMRDEAMEQVESGYKLFLEKEVEGICLMDLKIRSEVKLQVAYNGFRMFGMLDFLVWHPYGKVLLDGKGNKQKDADARQLLYYGLMLHASQERLLESGFMYWRHGFEPVDLSAKGLYDFVNGDFAVGLKVFKKLQAGVDKLPANPSNSSCFFCLWRDTCEHSACKKAPSEVFVGCKEITMGS